MAGMVSSAPFTASAQTSHDSREVAPKPFVWPEPITINEAIQVLDWRPFPTPDHPRFIAEIKNISNEIIDAPTIGLMIPNHDAPNDYAWANPWNNILLPGQSTFVIGVLDTIRQPEEALDAGRWISCSDEITHVAAKTSHAPFLEWSDKQVDVRYDWGLIEAVLTNQADHSANWFTFTGILRDMDERIVGANFKTTLSLESRESKTLKMYVLAYSHRNSNNDLTNDNLANPYYLLQPGDKWTIDLSVDTLRRVVSPGCPAIMPWNR